MCGYVEDLTNADYSYVYYTVKSNVIYIFVKVIHFKDTNN